MISSPAPSSRLARNQGIGVSSAPYFRIGSLALVLFLASSIFVERAHANPEATALLEEGLSHYADHEYEAALKSFREGFELDDRADFLFAMGQTERLSGDCESAVVFYRRFLDTKPAKLHADLATQMVEKCEVALRSSPVDRRKRAQAPDPSHQSATLAPAAPKIIVLEGSPANQPWHRDPVGVTLLGTGVASALAGTAFLLTASKNSSAAESAPSFAEHSSLLDRAKKQQTVGLVGLGAGAALLSGATLYYLFSDQSEAKSSAVSVGFSPSHLQTSVAFSF